MLSAFFAERQKMELTKQKMPKVIIYDLDGTIIDSSHRVNFDAKGKFDLSYWIEKNTPENIWADSLLPLAKLMRHNVTQWQAGIVGTPEPVILTAREMGQHDHGFLRNHGLKSDSRRPMLIMSRDKASGEHRYLPDVEYKRQWLDEFLFCRWELSPHNGDLIAYDDNPGIIDLFQSFGIFCNDAKKLNKEMGANYRAQFA